MAKMSVKKQVFGLAAWLCLSLVVLALGALASIQAKSFYASLVQPSWAPPAWLFGPVWTSLYIAMAVSAWLVWRGRSEDHSHSNGPLGLYVAQLVVNALWSWLFFAWHLGGLAFADIIVMDGLIVATMFSFWKINKLAALLLVPYGLWVAFATCLNYAIWQLNPGALG